MRLYLLILLFLPTTFLKAQTIKQPTLMVDYTLYDHFRAMELEAVLCMNTAESLFYTNTAIYSNDKPQQSGGAVFLSSKHYDSYQYTNRKNNQLRSFESTNDKLYAIDESIPNLNWNIDYEETKTMHTYTCHKATVDFRGRSYIAWYTPEIPVFFGPWKFSGLPGLILEVKDKANQYHWLVQKISTNSDNSLTVPYKNAEVISLEKMVALKKEDLDVLRARILSKLPKGSEVSTPANPRNSYELLYEWEHAY